MADIDPSSHMSSHAALPPSVSAVEALLADQPRMLNLVQVANLLSTSAPTIRRLVETGALPAVRLSRQWRVARDDLRTYLLTPSELEHEADVPGE